MSARPISASDPRAPDRAEREAAAASAAGWRDCDLRWERLQEEAAVAWQSGEAARAAELWRAARRLAFWRMRRSDPRYATSLANAAMAARLAGREGRARRLYARAERLWSRVSARVETLEPSRRARSSLFHLRLEARHADAYRANQRARIGRFVAETGEVLTALRQDREAPTRLYERWRAEKLPVYDEARVILSAALLLADGRRREDG